MEGDLTTFRERVRRALGSPPALGGARAGVSREGLVRAAVLVPIVWRHGEAFVVFTRRTMTVATHKGQISFPGGAAETGDADAIATALRESREEIGLEPWFVEVVGVLPDNATSTGFVVTPVVGFVDPEAPFAADPAEVAELFELPFAGLADPGAHAVEELEDSGRRYASHSYTVDGRRVWGATGRILASLFEALAVADAGGA